MSNPPVSVDDSVAALLSDIGLPDSRDFLLLVTYRMTSGFGSRLADDAAEMVGYRDRRDHDRRRGGRTARRVDDEAIKGDQVLGFTGLHPRQRDRDRAVIRPHHVRVDLRRGEARRQRLADEEVIDPPAGVP